MSGTQAINTGSATPQTMKTPLKPPAQALKGSNPTAPDSTNLKNFFQNLLNKNAPTNPASSSMTNIIQTPPNNVSSDPNGYFIYLSQFYFDIINKISFFFIDLNLTGPSPQFGQAAVSQNEADESKKSQP